MGKKISQSPVKICRNHEKQLHSLIQVLRPKVYITDTSSFKRLVQQLTGNISCSSNASSSPPPTKPDHHVVENVSIIDHTKESSMEAASFASLDHDSSELCHQITTLEDSTTVNPADDHDHQVDMLAYGDLESWLLEIDQPFPFYHDYAQIEKEVSIYDYELSGLI